MRPDQLNKQINSTQPVQRSPKQYHRDDKYKVLKISTFLQKHPTAAHRESKIYEHLAKINSTHPSQSLIREVHNSFELQGYVGKHRSLVLQPMNMTLLEMMGLNPEPFNLPLLKWLPEERKTARQLLEDTWLVEP